MPPYAERKIRLAATIPRSSICVSSALTQYVEQNRAARSTAKTERDDADDAIRRHAPASRGPPEQAERPHREHDREQHEGEDDRVVRVVRTAGRPRRSCVVIPSKQRADRGAAERPHPADDHDDERVEQPVGVDARREARRTSRRSRRRARRAPSRRRTRSRTSSWMLIPSAATICPVVDAGADHHPRARPLQPQPQQRRRRRSRSPRMNRRVVVYWTPATRRFENVSSLRGPRDVLGDAAEVGEHLVGEDDRDRDRDQRLPQLLALVPAQEDLLHQRARRRPTIDACRPAPARSSSSG